MMLVASPLPVPIIETGMDYRRLGLCLNRLLLLWMCIVPLPLAAETLDHALVQIAVEEPLEFQRQAAIAWKTAASDETHIKRVWLENGTNVYEMRGTPGWAGELTRIQLVASPALKARLEVVEPTFEREQAIAFRNQPWMPSNVNHLPEIFVGGGFTLHLLSGLLLVFLGLIGRFGFRLNWPKSVGLALVVTMLLVQTRFVVDRWTSASQLRAGDDVVYLYDEISQFGDEASPTVAGKPWTMVEVDRFRKYGMFYELAESPYVTKLNEAEFVISTKTIPTEARARVGKIALYPVEK